MTEQTESSHEKSSLLARLEGYGDPRKTAEWESGQEGYVAKLGLSASDVPELVAIARKWADPQNDWPDDKDYVAGYAPIHAWRCLAQLRAVEVIPVLLEMLDPLDTTFDDWSLEEFPHVFVCVGLAAMKPLCDYLADDTHRTFSRVAVAHGLRDLAEQHPQVRDEVVKTLTDALSQGAESDAEKESDEKSDEKSDEALNGSLVSQFLHLKATESAEVIERAFAAGRVDLACCGNWNAVRNELGVAGLGLVPEDLAARKPFAKFEPMVKAFKQLAQLKQAQKQAATNALINDTNKQALTNVPALPAGTYMPSRTVTTMSHSVSKVGRNDPCHCGSGKKYKKCCEK